MVAFARRHLTVSHEELRISSSNLEPSHTLINERKYKRMAEKIQKGTVKAQYGSVSVMSTGNTWVLRNPRMRVTVSKSNGQILSIFTRKELLSAAASAVLTDIVDAKTLTITDVAIRNPQTNQSATEASVAFTTELSGGYVATTKLTITRDALRWDVEASSSMTPDREVNIDFILPVLSSAEKAFWAAPNIPVKVADMRTQQIVYRTNTYLPWVCVYNEKTDLGLSLIAPPDLPKPGLTFAMETTSSPKRIRVSNHHLRMGVQHPAQASLLIVPHEGDWRPGLGWLSQTYPDYFQPVAKRVTDGEGWYSMSSPTTGEDEIKDAASRGVTWQEFHGHFPFYGLYLPERETWAVAMDQDAISLERWEKRNTPELFQNSLSNMRAKIALWKKHGIQTYIYYQSFEAWHQYAEKYFPADIARDAAGDPCIAWQFCNLMNPDPASPWGKAILQQLDRIIATYPDIDGVFLDRDDYRDYDFSHDDGLTMQSGRACYMLGFAQEKAVREIGARLHKRELGIWTNGPTNLEVCKGVDGIMSEAVGAMANLTQFFGLERPMICLPYDADAVSTEIKLKACLSGGYFPGATGAAPGSPSRTLEDKYTPLFRLMKGRKWVLTAHAITVPESVQGNLFQAPNGDYLATVVSEKPTQVVSAGSSPAMVRGMKVKVSVPGSGSIRYCYLLSADYRGASELPFTRTGSSLNTTIPLHIAASLLVFSTKPRYDLTRVSAPILVRGSANELGLHSSLRGAATVQTPWGAFVSKGSSETVIVAVPSDAVKGEVTINLSTGGNSTVFTAWVVDPVELVTPLSPVFVRNPEGEDVPIQLTNNTDRAQSIALTAAFVSGSGTVRLSQPRLTLKSCETRIVPCRVITAQQGRIDLRIESGGRVQTVAMPVDAVTRFDASDLFHDDFSSGNMGKWSISSGTWRVKDGSAQTTGPAHLAIIGDAGWSDYSIEVTTKMDGSQLPSVTWTKSYVFFRIQGPNSFYRFGFHGDSRSLELSKMVSGAWTAIASQPFDIGLNTWLTFRVVAKGAEIRCYADGKLIIQAKDDTLPKGKVGIGVMEDEMLNAYRHVVVKRIE